MGRGGRDVPRPFVFGEKMLRLTEKIRNFLQDREVDEIEYADRYEGLIPDWRLNRVGVIPADMLEDSLIDAVHREIRVRILT